MILKEKLKGTYLESLIKERKRKKGKKVEYDLCYKLPNKKNNVEEMPGKEIREYVETIYIKNKDIFINDKEARNLFEGNIRKDLLALRILKDDTEQKIKIQNYGISFISVFVASITVIIEGTISGVMLLIYILILLSIYIWMAKWYEKRLNSINYSTNILESIKEDIHFQKEKESKKDKCRYRDDLLNSLNSLKENKSDGILESKNEEINKNPTEIPKTKEFYMEANNVADQVSEPRKYSDKVNESLEDAVELLDENNKKEYSRSIMGKNIFDPYGIEVDEKGIISYKDSYGLKNDLTTKSKEDLAKYINEKYCNVNQKSREDILKDLTIFKNLRKTLELEYRSYESFIKNVSFLIAILSFAITSTKDLIKQKIPEYVVLIILFVSLAYLLGTGKYLIKIVDRKNGPGKLDVIDYGINVLETKLKELDGNQDK